MFDNFLKILFLRKLINWEPKDNLNMTATLSMTNRNV